MGSKGSKDAPKSGNSISSSSSSQSPISAEPRTNKEDVADYKDYKAFRDQLLSFAMGESAYDYAEQLFKKDPDDPAVMALLAETTVLYDRTKNKVYRNHWVDRLDLLQRGVDVSRKCFTENPEYGPCYRTYVMCATRESEALYYLKSMKGIGLIQNYDAIMKRGEQGMTHLPKDAELPNALGALCARCAYRWYDPTRWYAAWYGLPTAPELRRRSIEYHKRAVANDPSNLEYACRLAQAYFQNGNFADARRWYIKVRDEMPPQELSDDRWQGLAHTQLSTAFGKSNWNVPFA